MTEKTRLDRLLEAGKRITETIGTMEAVTRRLIADHAAKVARGFLAEGFEVYTYGMFVDACIHEGGLPTVLVRNMPVEEAKRWQESPIVWVKDYDEFLKRKWFPAKINEATDITRLTLDNIDEVAQEKWRQT